jgi:hypothetical protein
MQLTSGGLYGALRAPSLMRRLQLILVFYRPSFKTIPEARRLGMEVAARAGALKRGRRPRVTPRRTAQIEALLLSGRSRGSRRAWGATIRISGASCPLHVWGGRGSCWRASPTLLPAGSGKAYAALWMRRCTNTTYSWAA